MSQLAASVVLSTRNKPTELANTLRALVAQITEFDYEVIVVDDGSTPETLKVCDKYIGTKKPFLRYFRLENDCYRNPSIARNYGYRQARGKALVCMSDDVVCTTNDCLHHLINLQPNTFNIATVYNAIFTLGKPPQLQAPYTGKDNPRPFFFLGALLREHCYAIGGNCEEFTGPGYDDNWFGDCLIRGLGLKPVFLDQVVAYHQHHDRPPVDDNYRRMEALYNQKHKEASAGLTPWLGGEPWPLKTGGH